MLTNLKNSGLRGLKISFDDFHQDNLKVQRIKNILDANVKVRIPISLNVAVSKSFKSDKILADLGASILGVRVTKFPIQQVGAACQYSDEEIIKRYNCIDDLHCPGFEVTYHFDGKVYPCCSPTVFDTCLSVADVDSSVEKSIFNIKHNLLLSALRKRGFKWLFEKCIERGLIDDSYMNRRYVDACEMCRILFSSEETAKGIISILKDEYGLSDGK